jgi:hypothetical protein
MATDFGHWDRVASELRACREAQQEAWGDVDNATLGRYLAGDVTPQERRRIEAELRQRPELRKLTDLVSDVLRECGPVAAPKGASPSVLSFAAARTAPNAAAGRWRRWAAVAAAACLLLGLTYTVLPKGARPAASSQADLARHSPYQSGPFPAEPISDPLGAGGADVKPASGIYVAMRPTLGADGAPDGWSRFFAKRDDRDARKVGPVQHVAVVLADGCATLADSYEKEGDLDMAEFSYRLAYDLRDWTDGAKAPPTVEARRNLADVYQTAFNTDRYQMVLSVLEQPQTAINVEDPQASRLMAVTLASERVQQMRQMVSSANQLRKRLARQRPDEVRRSVVPVLVEKLKEATTPEARAECSRALAELGAAAKDALPALDACLAKKDLSESEREAVEQAKKRLEKAAEPATPADAPRPE